jgi:HD superfamily phosphohydrolase
VARERTNQDSDAESGERTRPRRDAQLGDQAAADRHGEETGLPFQLPPVTGEVTQQLQLSEPASRRRDQETFVPVHGQVRLNLIELEILDHPAVQRLGRVYQLGQVHLIYRGATHRRLEHSIGTVHVAQLIIDSLARNVGREPVEAGQRYEYVPKLTRIEVLLVRLGALLHDIGHLPAGHTLEDELGLLPKHDALERIDAILDRDTWAGVRSESLRDTIDRLYSPMLTGAGIRAKPVDLLLEIITRRPSDPLGESPAAHEDPAGEQSPRISICRDIVGNTICADLLDYLPRDWHHLGKPKYFDTRLIEYMEIRRDVENDTCHLVVNLRTGETIRSDAITAILELLADRYQLNETAIFHRTKLCAAAMLERAIAEIAISYGGRHEAWLAELADLLLEGSDDEIPAILTAAATKAKEGHPKAAQNLDTAILLVQELRLRRLFKQVYVSSEYHLSSRALQVQRWFGSRNWRNRTTALRLLEDDFSLAHGSLAIYCPPAGMNSKIARVKCLVDDQVMELHELERTSSDRGITGGHLEAQELRFRRLWRVLVAAKPEVIENLKNDRLYPLFIRSIEYLVMGRRDPGVSREEVSASLASELAQLKGQGPIAVAARGQPALRYPSGAPSLSSFKAP